MDSQPLKISSTRHKSFPDDHAGEGESGQFQSREVAVKRPGDGAPPQNGKTVLASCDTPVTGNGAIARQIRTSTLHSSVIKFQHAGEGFHKDQLNKHVATVTEHSLNDISRTASNDTKCQSLQEHIIPEDVPAADNSPAAGQKSRAAILQASLIEFLSTKAGHEKNRFSKHIATITAHSLNDIRQSTSKNTRCTSLQKRVILGDALNAFNREINKAFFGSWFYATELLNKAPKAPPADVYSIMFTAFDDLYKTLSTQRLQLFVAAGYLNKSELSRDELMHFEPIVDKKGREFFYPDNLLNALRHRSHTTTSDQLNGYLSDLTHFLAAKTPASRTDTASAPPVKATENAPVADKLLLLSLFHHEKELFIDDVQRLCLQNANHVDGQVPLHEAGSDDLLPASMFSAPLKDPGHYRGVFPLKKQADLPGPPQPILSVGARQVTEAFNATAHKIAQQTLAGIERTGNGRESVHKRVLLGDALNALNDHFDQQFLAAFDRAHRGLPAIEGRPSAILPEDDLNPIFQQMYTTLADRRTRLFVDAGYIDTDMLRSGEALQFTGGLIGEEDQPVFFPAPLIKLIHDNLIPFDPDDPFDSFLNDFAASTIEDSKITLMRDPEAHLEMPEHTMHGTQQLAHILAQDKMVFIDTIQALQLRDNVRFNDELSLDKAHLSPLFAPDTFLDVVKDPDAHRTTIDHTHTRRPAPAESVIALCQDSDQPPAVSSAIRPRGALDDLKEGLVALFSPAIDSDSQPDTAAYSAHFDHTGNLVLATLLTSRFHDRQLSIQRRLVMPGQDPLSQSSGMRLLTDSQVISARLQTEANAFINQLKTSDEPISAYWNQDDLVNIAILQSTAETSGAVTECFLYEVLRSPHVGIKREQPENIFAADGRVRGNNDRHIFHNPVTGKTTPSGAAGALARTMLQAMASQRLAGNSQINLPDGLHREIIRQVDRLYHRQETTAANVLIPGYGPARPSAEEITEVIHKRLASEMQPVSPRARFDPVLNTLNRGLFAKGRKLFMQLSPRHQMESVLFLAGEPDYLGMSLPQLRLKKLQTDILYHGIKSDWQLFTCGEQAWELLTNLYDRRIAAPEEAINRINVQTMINRRGINNAGEAMQLRQLLVQLLPGRTSASDFASATQRTGLQPPVKLHQFEPERIAGMISDYQTIRKYLDQHCFPRIFGDTITDPQLRREVVNTVARITLDACKGSIASESWQRIAVGMLAEEYWEFIRAD